MNNYGFILLKIRKEKGLTIKQAAQKIGRSTGWLSGIESGKARLPLSEKEYDRILKVYGVEKDIKKFAAWVTAKVKTEKKEVASFDGAILKHLRKKKCLSLEQVSNTLNLSKGYLSKLECGQKPISKELKDKLLEVYGYNPGSYKNFTTNDQRAKSIPCLYKLNILLNGIPDEKVEEIFEFAKTIAQVGCQNLE